MRHVNARYRIALVWLLLVSLMLVGPAYSGGWILDDAFLIAENGHLREPGAWSRWFFTDMWDVTSEEVRSQQRLSYYRPLPMISYHWDWALGDGSPVPFHITNALLHGGVGLFLAQICRRWVPWRTAVLAGFFFVVHPARMENVAWISGRTDLFCALGVLLALDGALATNENRARGWFRQVAGVLIAYLSKEHAVVLPVFVLFALWAAVPGRWSWDSLKKQPFLLRCFAAHGAIAVLYLGARRLFLPIRSFEVKGLGVGDHGLLVLETLGRALESTLIPLRLAITTSSLEKTNEGIVFHVPLIFGAGLALILLGLAVALLRRKQPLLVGSLLLFAFALAPTLNLVWSGALHVFTPRFLYIPSLALSFSLALFVGKKKRLRRGGALIVVALAGASWWRAGHFSDPEAFYAYELESNPRDPMNVRHAVYLDRQEPDLTLALRRIQCGHRYANSHYPQRGEGEQFLLEALELVVKHTPDHQVAFLDALSSFLDEWLAGKATQVGPPLGLQLGAQAPQSQNRMLRGRLFTLSALVHARRGRSSEAVGALRGARKACPQCSTVQLQGPEIALRARADSLAEEWWRELGALNEAEGPAAARLAEVRGLLQAASGAAAVERGQLLSQREVSVGNYRLSHKELERAMAAEEGELPPAAFVALGELAAQSGDRGAASRAFERAGFSKSEIAAKIEQLQKPLRLLQFPLREVEFEAGGCRLRPDP